MSLNKAIIMGNITRDPEVRQVGDTNAVDFSIAINDSYTDNAGKRQDRVTFIDVTAWGKTADNIGKYIKQGDSIIIEGSIKQDKWQDKKTGENRTKLKIQAQSVTFVNTKKKEDTNTEEAPASTVPRGSSTPSPTKTETVHRSPNNYA